MNTINQTDKELKRIEAKQTLGLPLTTHETALLALYGTIEREQTAGNIADEESARKARFVAEYLSPLLRAADMANIERHKQLCAQLTDTYQKKNADYGNSFGDTFADLGIISAITRIADKFNRVKNLAKLPPDRQRVKSESITDTLLDMANYCIMTVIEIENQNKQGGANNE